MSASQERGAGSAAVFRKLAMKRGPVDMKDVRTLIKVEEAAKLSEPRLGGVVFVDTPVSLCRKRIGTRGQVGDQLIDTAYLEDCRNYHIELMSEYTKRGYEVLWLTNIRDNNRLETVQFVLSWMSARTFLAPYSSEPSYFAAPTSRTCSNLGRFPRSMLCGGWALVGLV